MVHDPVCARAEANVDAAERNLAKLQAQESDAIAAATGTPVGPANDPTRQPHRRVRLLRDDRERAEAELTEALARRAEANAKRAAATAMAQQLGYEHLAFGRAAVHGYWESILRSRKRVGEVVSEAPSGLQADTWMSAGVSGGTPLPL